MVRLACSWPMMYWSRWALISLGVSCLPSLGCSAAPRLPRWLSRSRVEQTSTHSLQIDTPGGPLIRRSTCSAVRPQKLQVSPPLSPSRVLCLITMVGPSSARDGWQRLSIAHRLGNHLVDQTVGAGLFGAHIVVAFAVLADLLDRLAGDRKSVV